MKQEEKLKEEGKKSESGTSKPPTVIRFILVTFVLLLTLWLTSYLGFIGLVVGIIAFLYVINKYF